MRLRPIKHHASRDAKLHPSHHTNLVYSQWFVPMNRACWCGLPLTTVTTVAADEKAARAKKRRKKRRSAKAPPATAPAVAALPDKSVAAMQILVFNEATRFDAGAIAWLDQQSSGHGGRHVCAKHAASPLLLTLERVPLNGLYHIRRADRPRAC